MRTKYFSKLLLVMVVLLGTTTILAFAQEAKTKSILGDTFEIPSTSPVNNSPDSGSSVRYAGPFLNTSLGLGGSVLINMEVEPTTVSGSINFTDGPNVSGVLCGAGNFSGSRNGDNFNFSFTSNDPEPGCGITNGLVFNVNGTISGNDIINGTFTVDNGQGGTFNAKQTIRSNGRFFNDDLSMDGDVYVDLATWSNTTAGYINFTGDPGDPALCGANSFTGTRNGNNHTFSFLSSDPDPGCEIIDDERFNISAILSGNNLQNGIYYLPDFGQGGTFSTSGPAVDTTNPSGNVTSPASNANIGTGAHIIAANASDNSGGTGMGYVKFYVKYNGGWHYISTDPTPPYSARWSTPAGLHSQQIRFAIHVADKIGNTLVDAGGHRMVNFIESIGDDDIEENWVDVTNYEASYLNQLSLSSHRYYRCGGSSTSMLLAINSVIPSNYSSLANTATTVPMGYDQYGNPLGSFLTAHVMSFINNQGMTANKCNCCTANSAWNTIRSEIDAGRPLIILSSRVVETAHYFTVVGYREADGDRQIRVYDPYGRWLGVPDINSNNYDSNAHSANSHKGYFRIYDFDNSWGYTYGGGCGTTNKGYMLSANSTQFASLVLNNSNNNAGVPTFPPGEISDEPEDIVTYEGIGDVVNMYIYLPAILR